MIIWPAVTGTISPHPLPRPYRNLGARHAQPPATQPPAVTLEDPTAVHGFRVSVRPRPRLAAPARGAELRRSSTRFSRFSLNSHEQRDYRPGRFSRSCYGDFMKRQMPMT